MKLKPWQYGELSEHAGKLGGYTFWCPACNGVHQYWTYPPPHWQFNGDLEKPTFTPSLLMYETAVSPRCHLFVTDGQIRYCDDCGHALSGQTVPMVDLPKEWE